MEKATNTDLTFSPTKSIKFSKLEQRLEATYYEQNTNMEYDILTTSKVPFANHLKRKHSPTPKNKNVELQIEIPPPRYSAVREKILIINETLNEEYALRPNSSSEYDMTLVVPPLRDWVSVDGSPIRTYNTEDYFKIWETPAPELKEKNNSLEEQTHEDTQKDTHSNASSKYIPTTPEYEKKRKKWKKP